MTIKCCLYSARALFFCSRLLYVPPNPTASPHQPKHLCWGRASEHLMCWGSCLRAQSPPRRSGNRSQLCRLPHSELLPELSPPLSSSILHSPSLLESLSPAPESSLTALPSLLESPSPVPESSHSESALPELPSASSCNCNKIAPITLPTTGTVMALPMACRARRVDVPRGMTLGRKPCNKQRSSTVRSREIEGPQRPSPKLTSQIGWPEARKVIIKSSVRKVA